MIFLQQGKWNLPPVRLESNRIINPGVLTEVGAILLPKV